MYFLNIIKRVGKRNIMRKNILKIFSLDKNEKNLTKIFS